MCFNQLEAKGLAREWINRPSSLRNDKTGVVSLSFWHCFCRPRALTSSAVARGSFFPALQSKEEKLGSRTHHESGSPSAIWACTQRCCLYRVRPFTWTESQLPVVCLQPAYRTPGALTLRRILLDVQHVVRAHQFWPKWFWSPVPAGDFLFAITGLGFNIRILEACVHITSSLQYYSQ